MSANKSNRLNPNLLGGIPKPMTGSNIKTAAMVNSKGFFWVRIIKTNPPPVRSMISLKNEKLLKLAMVNTSHEQATTAIMKTKIGIIF